MLPLIDSVYLSGNVSVFEKYIAAVTTDKNVSWLYKVYNHAESIL